MIAFENDDAGYLAWLQDHPTGFVVNTRKHSDAKYVVLHRCSCPLICSRERESGAYTSRDYRKIGIMSLAELPAVARMEGRQDGSPSKRCMICKA